MRKPPVDPIMTMAEFERCKLMNDADNAFIEAFELLEREKPLPDDDYLPAYTELLERLHRKVKNENGAVPLGAMYADGDGDCHWERCGKHDAIVWAICQWINRRSDRSFS